MDVVPPQNEKIFLTTIFPFYRGLYIRCIGGLTHSTSKMINLNIRGFSLKCVFLTSNEEVVTEAQWSRVQVGKMLNLK